MGRDIPIVDRSVLQTMHTGALISRLRHLLECEESLALSDRVGDEQGQISSEVIEFKNTDIWRNAYSEVKEILAHREHLPRAEERRVKRMSRAGMKKSTHHERWTNNAEQVGGCDGEQPRS